MHSHSSLVYLLFSLAFALYQVAAAVTLDDEVVEKLETGLFNFPSTLKAEVVNAMEEGENVEDFAEGLDESGKQRNVFVPAGWRRFRLRISGAT